MSRRPAIAVAPGERLLAWADAADGRVVGGTRDALYLTSLVEGADVRLPWEQVEAATWDDDARALTVTEVGSWGAARPEHRLALVEPGRLLQLVRERVTASVVLQRHVPVTGRHGVRVIARQAPGARGDLTWLFAYDEGIDPDDPVVRLAADEALAAARADVGDV